MVLAVKKNTIIFIIIITIIIEKIRIKLNGYILYVYIVDLSTFRVLLRKSHSYFLDKIVCSHGWMFIHPCIHLLLPCISFQGYGGSLPPVVSLQERSSSNNCTHTLYPKSILKMLNNIMCNREPDRLPYNPGNIHVIWKLTKQAAHHLLIMKSEGA